MLVDISKLPAKFIEVLVFALNSTVLKLESDCDRESSHQKLCVYKPPGMYRASEGTEQSNSRRGLPFDLSATTEFHPINHQATRQKRSNAAAMWWIVPMPRLDQKINERI